jgi:glutaminyl-tRNA synthetase
MNNNNSNHNSNSSTSNFIRNIITDDLASGKHNKIITRFPPEPNGYLHIGHAKSICLNFGVAKEFNGECNLRFDDTNPDKESHEFVESIKESINWLGFSWHGQVKYASDYFEKLYEFAVFFIQQGLAYVCDLTGEEMSEYRGTLNTPGRNSPYRNRSVAENLDLFSKMRAGEFPDYSKTLRLKIDMAASNINMRDPVIYRIKRAHHIQTADKWCIYPMYDYTHCISDAIEEITHSCCTLEFEDHRPLYDWVVNHLVVAKLLPCHPRQIEFSRLELQYTVTSKRKLTQLVEDGLVCGWDDPRMSTIAGMRRRGYRAEGIRLFIARCGISKSPNIVDLALLEASIREDLEGVAPRVMAVLNPLKVVITNFEHGVSQSREADFHPQVVGLGRRVVELSSEIYIEHDDFMENPVSGWQRLTIGNEVRLRHSYILRCNEVIKNSDGTIAELRCTIDHDTLGKNPVDRKVKGVIHWVSSTNNVQAEIRLYDRLFIEAAPDRIDGRDFKEFINSNSLKVVTGYIEPAISNAKAENHYQFERLGYFVADRFDHDINNNKLVFNKIVSLKDSWKEKVK